MMAGDVTVAQFWAVIEGQPGRRPVRLALEELGFFSREVCASSASTQPTPSARAEGVGRREIAGRV